MGAAVAGRGGRSAAGAGRARRRGPTMSETSRDVLGREKRAAATLRGVVPADAPTMSLTRSGSRGAVSGGGGGGGRPANHGGDVWPQGARGPAVAGRGGRPASVVVVWRRDGVSRLSGSARSLLKRCENELCIPLKLEVLCRKNWSVWNALAKAPYSHAQRCCARHRSVDVCGPLRRSRRPRP